MRKLDVFNNIMGAASAVSFCAATVFGSCISVQLLCLTCTAAAIIGVTAKLAIESKKNKTTQEIKI